MWNRWLLLGFLEDDMGQDLIEYALLLAFLALVCVSVLSQLGTSMNTIWNGVTSSIDDAINALS